ncbi:MAG TPA: rhomboid family intramembrane serine protease [Gemmataceae bacterium]
MGIYDREYYRREGPSYLGSIINRGQVTKYLILINVVVFVIQQLTPGAPPGAGWFTEALWLNPELVLHGEVWRLLTYAFLHAGILHILFNMLFLWWFGGEMEELYGPKEFLAFYLVSAILGGVAFQLWAMSSGQAVCLGASGAVTAVMVLYAFHYPSRIIYFWFIPMPVWLFVAIGVGMDTLGLLTRGVPGMHSTTAVTVHLAGAAFGFAYYRFHWRLISWLPDFTAWKRYRTRSRSKLRVYHEEEPVRTPVAVAAPPSSGGEVDEQLEAKLDAVLQKVSQSGKDSLTDSERQILVRASEIYKKRRS